MLVARATATRVITMRTGRTEMTLDVFGGVLPERFEIGKSPLFPVKLKKPEITWVTWWIVTIFYRFTWCTVQTISSVTHDKRQPYPLPFAVVSLPESCSYIVHLIAFILCIFKPMSYVLNQTQAENTKPKESYSCIFGSKCRISNDL